MSNKSTFSYIMQFIFILFIDTAGMKPTVNKQYLSIANYTIFQMIMGTPGAFWLMYV